MEVLSLQADELGRGFVTLGDAHRYVKNQVNRWIMKRIVPLEGSSQTPSLRADGADHIVLSGRRIEVDPDPREPFEGGYVNLRRNPFTWRNAITRAEDFFGRSIERNQILQYLEGRQSCEVVGELRIGKTSLLLQIAREAPEYLTTRGLHPALAYIDLLDARCSKLSGWLRQLGMAFGWRNTPANLVDFANCIDEMLSTGRSPVLCLDEFERFTQQKDEFDNAFFYALRSATQKGMSIITSSQVHVSSLTNPENPTVSPLSGVLAFIPLAGFSLEEAHNFIARERGVTPFTADQTEAILRFARHRERQPGAGIHPLSLQVACFHVLEAARNGGALKSALRRADADMRNHLRSWPKMTAT
jgi:hypothetical protein